MGSKKAPQHGMMMNTIERGTR